jgi:hypothetical protein
MPVPFEPSPLIFTLAPLTLLPASVTVKVTLPFLPGGPACALVASASRWPSCSRACRP